MWMHDISELIRSFAWPLTVLIVLYVLRLELGRFLAKLTDSIGQVAQIKVGTKGLELKFDQKLAAVNSRAAAIQARLEQVKGSAAKGRRNAKPGNAADNAPPIPEELRQLATEYLDVRIEDYSERLRRKNELAREMGEVALIEGTSRKALAESDSEGLLLAFSSMVIAQPEPGDLALWYTAAAAAKRLHVRYRLGVALAVLISKGFVAKRDERRVLKALDRLEQDADDPLQKLISETKSLLQESLSGDMQADLG